ncbi:hypothetical protein PMAC_001715 [Pneumocystis sp. 'macacae']|nr:hypothetical protein PMAC_001715 [Pneumocystis sp. 'macacae']
MNFKTINQKLTEIMNSFREKKFNESLVNTNIKIKTPINDNLIISKYYHIYNEYIHVLKNYKLEESSFKLDKLNQNNSNNIYVEWENEVLKAIQHNGSNYLNEIKTINSLVEQWNNILLFLNETAINFSKNTKLNSFISRLWENIRIIFNRHMNSIFKFSVNSVLELEKHINNQLKNMKIQNESLESLPLFKIDSKVWNDNIKSLVSYQTQKPMLFIKDFKKEFDEIQEKLEKDLIIIMQRQEPTNTILKNIELNTKNNNISDFHIKLVKDIYNKLSKKIGKIVSNFLTLKSNNLSVLDINIICYLIRIIKLIRLSCPFGVNLNFFCDYHLKKLYKTLSLYIFLNKNIKKRLETEIKKTILSKKPKNLWKDNENSLPNHPSSEIVAIIHDIGWNIINIGDDIFEYNAIVTIKYCFIDIIHSILKNTFNTKILNKDNHCKEYEKDGHNDNLYYEVQNSQSTLISITGQLQLYFDINYLIMLFENIPHKNKKLKKIEYIINVSMP